MADMGKFRSGIGAAVPEGWLVKESITVLAPDGGANVIASTEPLEADMDTERYAGIQGELLLAEFPGYREEEFSRVPMLGSHEGLLRRFTWVPPDGERVHQSQLYLVLRPGRGFTATATTTAARLHEYEAVLLQVLNDLTYDDGPSM
jgi:hypothetical protein